MKKKGGAEGMVGKHISKKHPRDGQAEAKRTKPGIGGGNNTAPRWWVPLSGIETQSLGTLGNAGVHTYSLFLLYSWLCNSNPDGHPLSRSHGGHECVGVMGSGVDAPDLDEPVVAAGEEDVGEPCGVGVPPHAVHVLGGAAMRRGAGGGGGGVPGPPTPPLRPPSHPTLSPSPENGGGVVPPHPPYLCRHQTGMGKIGLLRGFEEGKNRDLVQFFGGGGGPSPTPLNVFFSTFSFNPGGGQKR